MIKFVREYSQDFDVETQRIVVSKETNHLYLFGIRVYSFTYNTAEVQKNNNKTKVGF